MFYIINRKNIALRLAAAVLVLLFAGGIGFAYERLRAPQDGVPLCILMYHSLLEDPARTGKYVVTPDEFERDLIYLKEHGYTTITAAQAAAHVYDGAPLPPKPVMLTFDDGYYNNYLYALPLLKKHGMNAVVSVIGIYSQKFSENPENNAYYSHVTWDMIREMAQSGCVEILNHSYDMHTISGGRRGSGKKRGESAEQYEKAFSADVMRAQNLIVEKTGCVPLFYTYPFGSIGGGSGEILKKLGFLGSLSCTEGVNYITDDPECLFEMKRYLRPGGRDSQSFFKKIRME